MKKEGIGLLILIIGFVMCLYVIFFVGNIEFEEHIKIRDDYPENMTQEQYDEYMERWMKPAYDQTKCFIVSLIVLIIGSIIMFKGKIEGD